MRIKISINKYYLLIHALRQHDIPFNAWENLQNALWDKYPKAFNFLTFHSEVAFIGNSPLNEFKKICNEEVQKLITEAFLSREFKKLYGETSIYLKKFKKQWNQHGKKAMSIMEELSGLKMPKNTINVYSTHPKLYRSFALPQNNFISLGYADDWPNSSVVYLCHEIMHLMTVNTKIMHALIRLMVDNELRIRLNKGGSYFARKKSAIKNEPIYAYFADINKLENKIKPLWRQYLNNKIKVNNIIELEQEINKKLKKQPH